MFRVSGGQLALERLHIDVTLPDASGEGWTMFQAEDAELIPPL
jgi:hypothetical protein